MTHNTISTFAKRQDARDFAKSVNGKVQDRSKSITLAEGDERWEVLYTTSEQAKSEEEVQGLVDHLKTLAPVLNAVSEASNVAPEEVQEVKPRTVLHLINTPKKGKGRKVHKGKKGVVKFVENLKGKQVPVLHKRQILVA